MLIARIATGEVDDDVPDDGKDPAAKALGKKGGAARAKSMTPERRAEIAKKAAAKRWQKWLRACPKVPSALPSLRAPQKSKCLMKRACLPFGQKGSAQAL